MLEHKKRGGVVLEYNIHEPHVKPEHVPEDKWIRVFDTWYIIKKINANGLGSELFLLPK